MKTILKLHPHRHTGKLLHHRHTSYRALFLLLALTGAVLLTPVDMARADSYLVSAVVPAPLPDDPAVITSPRDGSVVNQPNIIVKGNCPVIDPPIIVVLYDGSVIVGSQYCGGDGSFSIPISLTVGSHSIVPHITNFTGQSGPTGNPVLITFDPPAITTSTTTVMVSPGGGQKQTSPPLEILTDSPYVLYGPKKDAVWSGTVRGGTPPYGITLDWGDGAIENHHNISSGPISLRHHYSRAKLYELHIELRDTQGHVRGLSIVALSPAIYNNSGPTIVGSTNLSRNWTLYTLYTLTVVALTLFWHRERTRYAHQPVPAPTTRRRRQPAAKARKR